VTSSKQNHYLLAGLIKMFYYAIM